MDFDVLAANLTLAAVGLTLATKLWRTDVYFATFFSMLVLYALIPAWGYSLYPEISQVVLRMYFGNEPLIQADWFTTASLIALFACYFWLFEPMTTAVRFGMRFVRPVPGIVLAFQSLYVIFLFGIYLHYIDVLSYSNASDEDFLNTAGAPYKLFWVFYKFSTFVILVCFALIRSNEYRSTADRIVARVLLAAHSILFLTITAAVGSRTDPLALSIGVLAYEYYFRKHCRVSHDKLSLVARRRQRRRWLLACAAFIGLILVALTALEYSRGGGAVVRDDLDVSSFAQGLLLKDYYWPYHVLIGAISYNYVDPINAIASNIANSLAFLGVDYLQVYVVNLWESNTVTRTASPAFYALTEGYVMAGWAGFIYNGVFLSIGLGLWRMLSRSTDEHFNAIAFAICVAVAATVVRSQSSYFIKDLYIWFLPALMLYAVATGLRPTRLAGLSESKKSRSGRVARS